MDRECEWEKPGYQDAIFKLFHENAERGLGVCGATHGPVGARSPHRLAALHQLLQHGAGSGAASQRRWPAHPRRPPAWWPGSGARPAAAAPPRRPGDRRGRRRAQSVPAPRLASRHRPARCRSCCTPAPGPAPPPSPTSARRHAYPPARPPGTTPPPPAGRWQQRLGDPAGRLAEVVRRTHPRRAVDQQPESQKPRPPTAQASTGPGQPLRGSSSFQPHAAVHPVPTPSPTAARAAGWPPPTARAARPQRSGTAARSPRRPRTSRPMLRIGPAHLPPAPRPPGPKVIHAATVRPPLDGRASVDQEPQGTW